MNNFLQSIGMLVAMGSCWFRGTPEGDALCKLVGSAGLAFYLAVALVYGRTWYYSASGRQELSRQDNPGTFALFACFIFSIIAWLTFSSLRYFLAQIRLS